MVRQSPDATDDCYEMLVRSARPPPCKPLIGIQGRIRQPDWPGAQNAGKHLLWLAGRSADQDRRRKRHEKTNSAVLRCAGELVRRGESGENPAAGRLLGNDLPAI